MGLFIITGTMGGGKSYFAAELALKCWARGGWVHSNVPWNEDELQKLGYLEKHIKLPEDHTKWVRKGIGPDGVERLESEVIIGGSEDAPNLVLVDEAALMLHAYDQLENRKRNRTLFELVVMSRQIGVDMYFISQSAANIDAAIRKVAEMVIHCINVKRIPVVGPLMAKVPFFFGDFRRNWCSPQKGHVLTHEYARFSQRVAAIYNTTGVGDKIGIARQTGKQLKTRVGFAPVLWVLGVAAGVGLVIRGSFMTAEKREAVNAKLAEKPDVQAAAATLDRMGTVGGMPSVASASRPVVTEGPVLIAYLQGGAWVDDRGRLYTLQDKPGARRVDQATLTPEGWSLQLMDGRNVLLKYDTQ